MIGLLNSVDSGPELSKSEKNVIPLKLSIETNISSQIEKKTFQSSVPLNIQSNNVSTIPDDVQSQQESKLKPQSYLHQEPYHYSIKELDERPEMIGEINTRPAELAQYQEGGEIKIQIWIDETGNVIKSEVINSNLTKPFIEYTIKSFNQSKFTPGIKDGSPVRSVAKVVVQYSSIN